MTPRSPSEGVGPEDFHRARAIFESVLDSPAAQRPTLVEEACAGDKRLLLAVLAMLRADAEPHSVLDGLVAYQPDRWQPDDIVAGHFRIVSLVGRGGMGDVYRAHDTTLARDVALKVLAASALQSEGLEERLARFEREAHVLASLNHVNIAAIYGITDVDGVRALVLELVDGPTLAERLQAGPIPLTDVVTIARQITVGLEAAHEQGIIHRDLKPSNIKLRPDGVMKLLDFGLAKVVQPEIVAESVASIDPAITSPSMIQRGALLGTAAYMSPEQAKGRDADRRSDVWAFGAILHEMLSGERAFKGDDVTETLAAVLRSDIDDSRLPASTPVALRRLVTRCLERGVSRRLRDIGEARIVLEDLSTASTPLGTSEQTRNGRPWRWRHAIAPAVAAIVGAAVAAIALWPTTPRSDLPVTRFVLSLRPDQTLLVDPQSIDLAITPDGTRVVYKGGSRVGHNQLFAYALDQLTPQPLTAPGLPKGPFTSPDGRWIGFVEPGPGGVALKKVAITGGPTIDVSKLDGPGRGATWGEDDTIIAASASPSTGLLRIPANGGDPTVLTRPNRDRGEADHLFPRFLPGSTAVLYTITALNGDIDAAQVAVLDIASGTSRTLIRGASQAHYLSSGHLVYVAGGALWCIAFDPTRLETIGTAMVVLPQVVRLPTGVAEFDISRNGTLVYVAGGGASDAPRTLVWVDRQGQEVPISAPPRPYSTLQLSPDATRVAVEIEGDGNDIWVWDFARETLARVTTDPGPDQSPVWMPDGRRLVFTSQAGGVLGSLFWQAADGSGVAERLTEGTLIQRASSVLPDGSAILFSDPSGLQMFALDERRIRTVMRSPQAGEQGAISPDGRSIAYVVRGTGPTPQVFVSRFSSPDSERTLVSRDGGTHPLWSPDGREIFFIGPDSVLMSAPVAPGPTIRVGVPTRVLQRPYYTSASLFKPPGTYDVSPDGRRFLMLKQVTTPNQASEPATVIVVKNWMEELRRLMPVPR
jgi:eukaryotic-like serine/threonine-protein kinase